MLIQGVGPIKRRKLQDQYCLYEKTKEKDTFWRDFESEMEHAFDNLCLLVWSYGDSLQLGAGQRHFWQHSQLHRKK